MGFHTFDAAKADRLEDAAERYRYLSREELLDALDLAPAAPDTSETLGAPEASDTPEAPDIPDRPDTPEAPEGTATPDTPGGTVTTHTSDAPDANGTTDAPDTPNATVADLGSGTGFYTDDVAPAAGRVFAVDIQEAMHDHYRSKGLPENVDLVTSEVADLPFATDTLDAAFSTMTYHEFATPDALAEVRRVIASGGRFVVADWDGDGAGESGPPVDERFTTKEAVEALEDAGFEVIHAASRPETFLVVALA